MASEPSNVSLCAVDTKSFGRCADQGVYLPMVDESDWSDGFRIFLYAIGLMWMFTAVALIADTFMCAIENITSQTREIKVSKPGTEEGFEVVEIKVWNATIANLTLMALGSSTPEILLSIIEIVSNDFKAGELGPGTIVGSAAFNLLVIIAVCVMSIPKGESKHIDRMNVFFVTALFSILAYVWIVVVLLLNTPDEVDLWEAIVTFLLLPILLVLAFIADKDYCAGKQVDDQQMEIELGSCAEDTAMLKVPKSEEEHMRDVVEAFMKSFDQPEKINENDAAQIAASRMSQSQQRSRAWYRVRACRQMLARRAIELRLNPDLQKINQQAGKLTPQLSDSTSHSQGGRRQTIAVDDVLGKSGVSLIEFEASSVSVMENCGSVSIQVNRKGAVDTEAKVKYETFDGTATSIDDYVATAGILKFSPSETSKHITVQIIDDNIWEPDEVFFLKLTMLEEGETVVAPPAPRATSRGPALQPSTNRDSEVVQRAAAPEPSGMAAAGKGGKVKLGRKIICQINIINDDEPGTFEFTKPSYLVKESIGVAQLPVKRFNGADGVCEVRWTAKDISGKEGIHYIGKNGKVTFQHGETEKSIEVPIINDHATKKEENFEIQLVSLTEGAQFGQTQKTIVTVVGDDEFDGLVRRVTAKTHLTLEKYSIGTQTWIEQFKEAMQVNGGDLDEAGFMDYVMHFITFGFKVLFAACPPPSIWGGWACFVAALGFIFLLTIVIKDLASIFGCLVGLKPTVNAITVVALGTSLPDLFASMTAAQQEEHADDCIGNVTGSNSVNVFLGLGLPWVLAAIYWTVKEGTSFHVPAGDLAFSVSLYSGCAVLCILTLIARHYLKCFGPGELGGPSTLKYATGVFFLGLWVTYITISSLFAYGLIDGF